MLADKLPLMTKLFLRTQFTADGCWLWQGATWSSGYGAVQWRGQQYKVHRLSAHMFLGLRKNSKELVCHKCDVPSCFNPEHLFIGTSKQNTQDSINKLRFSMGARHYKAKLTWPQVRYIRKRLAAGSSIASMARTYGVGESTIRHIKQRNSWKIFNGESNGKTQ